MNYDDFADLGQTSFGTGEPAAPKKDPKDELFHNVFICGKMRKDAETGLVQQPGTLNGLGIFDLVFNKYEVYMIPIHTKTMLAKEETFNNMTTIACFSYKTTNPAIGTAKKDFSTRECGNTSADRQLVDFCKPCRSQIILAGMLTDENGKAVIKEGKPVFIFVRGKGTKYGGVSNYLYEASNLDIPFIGNPTTPQQEAFEKSVVNYKRFVCKITIDLAPSAHGDQQVYKLERGLELNASVVNDIMNLSKKTLDKFNEKFDKTPKKADGTQKPVESNQQPSQQQSQNQQPEQPKQPPPVSTSSDFSFEDISF